MMTPDETQSPPTSAVAAPAPSQKMNLFILASKALLDKKINVEGETPRLVETVKDAGGNVLIHKNEILTKAIWQKFRTKPECKALHFICEIPMSIIDDINVSFLLPEDSQFLGALYTSWNKEPVAEQFFNEAIKSGTADAHINFGVFRYMRGEVGVMDNFMLAQRHFHKAMDILPAMPLAPDEKYKRQRICESAIDRIDYRFSSVFSKIIRTLIRILTFQFRTEVVFVGAASPKELTNLKIHILTEAILKQEFELKKAAIQKFMSHTRNLLLPDYANLDDELVEIEKDYGNFAKPESLDFAVARLCEFYDQHEYLFESQAARSSEAPTAAQVDDTPPPNVLCYELAPAEDIERLATRHRLTSVSELIEMAMRVSDDMPLIAWLIRDKVEQTAVMEKLLMNKSVSEPVKKSVRMKLRL